MRKETIDMKMTVFNGSPRGRTSNSHRIVEPLLQGARDAGAQTHQVYLAEKEVQHCRGCFSCWGATPGVCILQDDMAALIELYLDSDVVGLATPVYGMLMTGLLKNFTDRLLPLATPQIHRNEDGSFFHEGRVKTFPRQFVIANSGFPGGHNFDLLKAWAKYMNPVLEIYRNSGEVLSMEEGMDPQVLSNIDAFYSAVCAAGEELVANGAVSEKTVKRLHAELISDEAYMDGANASWDEEIGQARSEE
jgi:multimeric flavodoxin WrbA